MFSDAELDILARVYARILAWDDEEEADCSSAGSEPQSAGCGNVGESAMAILPDAASGEAISKET